MESSSVAKLPVFTTKKNAASGGVEIIDPKPGQQGWREEINGTFTEVFFDKGGTGRTPYEGKDKVRVTFEISPGWVDRGEYEKRKADRSRFWKKSKGMTVFDQNRNRAERFLGRSGYVGLYGSEAWA